MIPHVREAKAVEQAINSVIPDIKLFWNHGFQRWVVAQVKQNPGGIILPGFGDSLSDSQPWTLYKVETNDGSYREPSGWDVQRAVQIGRDGRKAIAQGGDWLVDKVEAEERQQRVAADNRLRSKVSAIAPEMKRAMRGDTQR